MSSSTLAHGPGFVRRHLGGTDDEQTMLKTVGYACLNDLIGAAVPPPLTEAEVTAELRALAAGNTVSRSMIGLGYYPAHTPAVIRRNVLEDPAWYTAYTPYQPEISQGRLEALLNFQTMVGELTGLPIANASLLDEPTAVAEAVLLMRRAGTGNGAVLVDRALLPQSLEVLRTRLEPLGIPIAAFDVGLPLPAVEFFGVVVAQAGADGRVTGCTAVAEAAHAVGALVTATTDLLALTLLTPPGEQGADIAVGSAQRFGVPMFYGGPHAGFMAVRHGLERHLPGRLVGVSRDTAGRPAYRLALQTREQHIRRDKATSNICTAQVLLAVVAVCYAVYHGPEGLRDIAERVHRHARDLAEGLRARGYSLVHEQFFDTVLMNTPGRAAEITGEAHRHGLLLRQVGSDQVAIACSETTTGEDVQRVLACFGGTAPLDRGMIPLGSCTMKLNAVTEMEPISWPEFADIHPFAPAEDVTGYTRLIRSLETLLAEITGYHRVSVQPNAGSQGELAGLLAIRGYHRARGEEQRDVCLIPSSAHGTNAASAVLAGLRVVTVKSRPDGTVDLDDLQTKCAEHSERLAAIMVTYPSTHGVYEAGITRLCELVHDHGGQVYIDGANLNALMGIAKPGRFGGDVSHLNLHKTFCIPHGGGGPGVGPVAVARHLAPFLPAHAGHPDPDRRTGSGPVSGAPCGSAGILPITWAFIRMMGAEGLRRASARAVLAANYIARRLSGSFPVLYTGKGGLVAHECILDLRPLTAQTGVTVDDVAKRLIDYGFHAPTISFPVAGTLMVEPTESEDLAEIDRFCAAMISIRAEIEAVAQGRWVLADSPLRRAPHTTADLACGQDHAYTSAEGAFPAGIDADKYWPPVGRIDQAYGDRHLVCSCPPPAAFEE